MKFSCDRHTCFTAPVWGDNEERSSETTSNQTSPSNELLKNIFCTPSGETRSEGAVWRCAEHASALAYCLNPVAVALAGASQDTQLATAERVPRSCSSPGPLRHHALAPGEDYSARAATETPRAKTLVGRGWNTGSKNQERTWLRESSRAWCRVFHALWFAAPVLCCRGCGSPAGRRLTRRPAEPALLLARGGQGGSGVYCCSAFGRELKPIPRKSVKLKS